MSIMMDLNTSMSPNECISIDFDEDDPNINLNYLEDYFDSLLNQLESELSYLPESSNFITNNKKNHDNNNDTSIINTNNVDNKSISYNRDVNIVSSCISSSIQNNLINNHESLNHHRNYHHNHHLNQLHTIDSTINSHNGADHANHQSTTNDTSNQQFKSDKIIITNQSSSTSSTSTTAKVNNYSSAPSLSKFNQRESPLSFSNYSRSSFYENNDEISYNLLTASQIQKIIDYYKPLVNSNNNVETTEVKWDRKTKKPNGTSNTNNLTYTNLFGCDVNNIEKAFGGLTLPPFIENALVYLARYGINAVGIFRKSGVKSRITALRQKLEAMTGSNKREPGTGTMTKKTMTDLPNGSPMNGGASMTLNRPDLEIGSGSSTINYRLSSSYAAGDDFCVYDVADMVKMWLREIKPRPLITKEVINAYKELMTNNNININNNNNSSDGPSPIELCHKLTVLLTDSQRAILEIFLNFLSLFAANCEINQMNSQNLAICFTPSLCECDSLSGGSGGFVAGAGLGGINQINTNLNNNILNNLNNNNNGLPFVSPSENGFNVNGSPLPRSADTEIIFDAQRCLQYLIDNCSYISMVSLSSLPFSPSPTLATFNNINNHESLSSSSSPMRSGEQGDSDHPMDGSLSVNEDAISTVNHLNPLMSSLSLSNDINCTINNNNNNFNTNGFFLNTSSSPSLINGGNLLPSTYESSIIINAAPSDILKRILYQKNLFDPTVVEWRVIKHSPSENCDVFEYKVQSSFFLPLKTFTIDRRWSFIENQPATETSTSSSPRSFYSSLKKSKSAKTSFKGIVLRETGYLYDSWWRIGTQGEGKCQLDISIAVDLRGHSYYWYTNTFPAVIDWQLYQIKQSFLVDFIETKNFKSTTV